MTIVPVTALTDSDLAVLGNNLLPKARRDRHHCWVLHGSQVVPPPPGAAAASPAASSGFPITLAAQHKGGA